jgi:hypothetical protein
MKFGPIPENLFERLALVAGCVPVPAIDALYGIMKTRSIMAGVRLGIFEAIGQGTRTAAALASALSLDEASLDLLLRTLAFAEYLEQRADGYALSPLARRTMLRDAPMSLVGFLEWNYTQWDLVAHLDAFVQTGRGAEFHRTLDDPQAWAHYQRAMFEITRHEAPRLVARVPVPRGARRLLDLGGSHGVLGATICRRHPPLRSTVVDLPAALPHARALAREAGIEDVVEHREGDALESELGADYDVAVVSKLLHHFKPADIARVLGRVRAALRSGGTIAIWETERSRRGSKVTDGDGAAFFFAILSTGGTYSGEDYVTWLGEAGFGKVRVTRPRLLPGNMLITGRS